MTAYFEVNPLYDSRATARVSFAVPCNNIVHSSSVDEMGCQGFCSVGDFICSSCILNIYEKERPTIV